MSDSQIDQYSEQLFQSKVARRRALAAKSVEEKFEILLKLQHMCSDVARQAGREAKKPWVLKPRRR